MLLSTDSSNDICRLASAVALVARSMIGLGWSVSSWLFLLNSSLLVSVVTSSFADALTLGDSDRELSFSSDNVLFNNENINN